MRRIVNLDDAAVYLGVTAHALRHKAQRGKIPVIRLDGRLRFDLRDLDAWIDKIKREQCA